MKKQTIMKQIAAMKEMLEDMRQERVEASAIHSETSEFMQQLDADISLAMLTIRNCQRMAAQIKETK